MAQQRFWIVKWMPDGDDVDGCKFLRGDNNRAYPTFDEAEERCKQIANEGRREVGVFELVAVYRPPLNVESVPVVGNGNNASKKKPAAKKKVHKH